MLCAACIPGSAQLLCFQGKPSGYGGRDTGMSWEKEVGADLCDLMRVGSQKNGRLPQVFYYRAGYENCGLICGRRGGGMDPPSANLLS